MTDEEEPDTIKMLLNEWKYITSATLKHKQQGIS